MGVLGKMVQIANWDQVSEYSFDYILYYYKLFNCAFGNSIMKSDNLQYNMVGLADYHLNVHFIKRTFESTVL